MVCCCTSTGYYVKRKAAEASLPPSFSHILPNNFPAKYTYNFCKVCLSSIYKIMLSSFFHVHLRPFLQSIHKPHKRLAPFFCALIDARVLQNLDEHISDLFFQDFHHIFLRDAVVLL